jgi:hypothetical protein
MQHLVSLLAAGDYGIQHAYRNHRDEVAAIMVKLFDQTLLADVEMLYIKETVFGVRDGAPLMDCTHPCLVALAAASHWPQHTHWPSHAGCDSTCLQSSL